MSGTKKDNGVRKEVREGGMDDFKEVREEFYLLCCCLKFGRGGVGVN